MVIFNLPQFPFSSQESVSATIIRNGIYTLADKETIAAAQFQITYRVKPQ